VLKPAMEEGVEKGDRCVESRADEREHRCKDGLTVETTAWETEI
jgi:hypothetical protein